MSVRRVVTGHDSSGRSVFASDEEVEPTTAAVYPGWEFLNVWGTDAAPVFPDDGSEPEWSAYFPPPGGLRFSFSTIPPEGGELPPDLDLAEAQAEAERALPGLAAHMEVDDPGMHTTDTIDLELIVKGEVILELDDGNEKLLRAGDTVVQNGTRHRWRNPGAEPAVMVIFMLGVRRGAQ
jgi:mannose-6-phosphate isomerase-like protein (cupin superfamily)